MGFGKKFVVGVVALVVGGGGAILPATRVAAAGSVFAKIRSYSYNAETSTLVAGSTSEVPNIVAANAASKAGLTVFATDLQSSTSATWHNVVLAGNSPANPAFDPEFDGGLTVAVGNVNASEALELVVGQATGGSTVRVMVPGAGLGAVLNEFQAFENGFTGGVRVATGDVNGDGTDEILVTPGPGRAPTLKAFNGAGQLVGSLDVFDPSFKGGVFVSAANIDGDAVSEIAVGPGAGAGPHVKILDGLTSNLLANAFAFDPAGTAGVRVALGSVSGTNLLIATSRTSAGPMVRALKTDGTSASGPVAVADADGDLHPYLADGTLHLVDAAPRARTTLESTLKDHVRGYFTVTGAGLPDTIRDVTIGTEEQGAYVTFLAAESDLNVRVGYAIPAGVSGPLPIEITVATPGGTATHVLKLTTLSVAPRSPALRDFVTTAPFTGGAPHVRTFSDQGPIGNGFYANADFAGAGARVARGDLDGDGIDEVLAATPAGPIGQVAVDNADGTHRFTLVPYGNAYRSGIFVTTGDLIPELPGNEIVTGADAGGGPHVVIYNKDGGKLEEFFAYGENFRGGVRVAVGDVDGDGLADIVTSTGPGGAPHVQALSPIDGQIRSFYAYAEAFSGGVYVATADVDGDGIDEIVTAPGAGGGPHVRMFGPEGAVAGFMAYAENFRGGVTVARVGDDILGPNLIAVGAGPGGGPHVQVFDPDGTSLDSFYAYAPNFTGGVWVAGGIG